MMKLGLAIANSSLMAFGLRFFTYAVLQHMQNHGLCCTSLLRKAAYRLDIISACRNGLVLVPPYLLSYCLKTCYATLITPYTYHYC